MIFPSPLLIVMLRTDYVTLCQQQSISVAQMVVRRWLLFKAITSGSVSWLCHAKYPLPLAQHQHNTTHPSMQNLFQFLKTCSFSNFHVRHCPFLPLLPHIPHSIVSLVAEATRSCCGGRGDGGGWHQGRVGWVETVHNRIL